MQQSHQPKAETRAIEIPNAILIPQIIKYLEQGHTVTLPLKGYSMRPFLENNRDMALLTSPRNIRVGAPVLAEIAPKRYVLHRIVGIKGNQVTLLGDGNLSPEHCLTTDIKASVEGFYRKGRKKMDRTDGSAAAREPAATDCGGAEHFPDDSAHHPCLHLRGSAFCHLCGHWRGGRAHRHPR